MISGASPSPPTAVTAGPSALTARSSRRRTAAVSGPRRPARPPTISRASPSPPTAVTAGPSATTARSSQRRTAAVSGPRRPARPPTLSGRRLRRRRPSRLGRRRQRHDPRNGGRRRSVDPADQLDLQRSPGRRLRRRRPSRLGRRRSRHDRRNGGRRRTVDPADQLDLQRSLGVAFAADGRHGWAVGVNGTIVATADGGGQWTPQTSSTSNALWGVAFAADGRHGWAVGDNGTIVATADGGGQWTPQTSSTSNSLWASPSPPTAVTAGPSAQRHDRHRLRKGGSDLDPQRTNLTSSATGSEIVVSFVLSATRLCRSGRPTSRPRPGSATGNWSVAPRRTENRRQRLAVDVDACGP